jgi:Nucleotide modification associated domain 5
MRLTNAIRDAFVRAAMADVPQKSYEKEIHDLIKEDAKKHLPPKVLELIEDPKTREFIKGHSHYIRGYNINNVWLYGSTYERSPKVNAKVEALLCESEEQTERINQLKGKLHAAAYSVTTRKALAEMLPEFEKYLPETEAKANRSLPVVANIVAEFTKAGWPKNKPKTK